MEYDISQGKNVHLAEAITQYTHKTIYQHMDISIE